MTATQLPVRHSGADTHSSDADGTTTSPATNSAPVSNQVPSPESTLPAPTILLPTPMGAPSGRDQTSASGHRPRDAHGRHAALGTDFRDDQAFHDTQSLAVVAESDRNGSPANAAPTSISRTLADPFLRLAADVLDDAENTRKANANRLGHLTRSTEDSDGEVRGLGLDESHPDVARLAALVDMLAKVEHQATLNLARLMRQHPLGPWIKAQKGVGDKQAARLLAVIGDPYLNLTTGKPRTVSQLWSYCGHGDASRRKRKGMTQADLFALGNPDAKMRVWNIAVACLKAQGYYADVYYERKAATEGREHASECVRCGPSGHPALPGSPWSDAHRHADALRIVGKEFLRDLWLEAKRIHEDGAQ